MWRCVELLQRTSDIWVCRYMMWYCCSFKHISPLCMELRQNARGCTHTFQILQILNIWTASVYSDVQGAHQRLRAFVQRFLQYLSWVVWKLGMNFSTFHISQFIFLLRRRWIKIPSANCWNNGAWALSWLHAINPICYREILQIVQSKALNCFTLFSKFKSSICYTFSCFIWRFDIYEKTIFVLLSAANTSVWFYISSLMLLPGALITTCFLSDARPGQLQV